MSTASKTVSYYITVLVEMKVPERITDIEPIINEMDYSFSLEGTTNCEVVDTEIFEYRKA